MNNKKIVFGIVGVLVLIGAFYGGMVYGKSQTPVRGQGAMAFGQNGVGGAARGARGGFGGSAMGQIISKDANSITVQIMTGGSDTTNQGGSKIIFLDSNTKITKSADGALSDLTVGTEVRVSGAANPDGSVNAQTVQITPKIVPPVVK